jgi:hypothetical protein
MTRALIAGGASLTALVLLVFLLVVRDSAPEHAAEPAASIPPAGTPEIKPGFIYGRITTVDGATYEGRLRWGGDQEAFWGDYFNGAKAKNPWAVHLRRAPSPIEIFGFEFGGEGSINLNRRFLARFGDIARIEAHFRDVQVTLKSGTVYELDRFSAGDIDDGVRVWDVRRGVADIDGRQIRTIEFFPTAALVAVPDRLHGTVRTRHGDFAGFILWDQRDCVGADELAGRTADSELRLRYDTIRSIARHSRDSARVTLLDGREILLSGSREVGQSNRGIYVDDERYGRVVISWDAFERVEFSPGSSGPAYGDFRPGRLLAGRVATRDGRRLAGRLVFDVDDSETTETLDTQSQGMDYYIPFDLITSIVPRDGDARGDQRARVTLRDGEELHLERAGDLREGNAGVLIFVTGRERPEHVPWADVEQIDLDHPPSGHR